MSINKGDYGYLKSVKKRELIKCAIQWGCVIAFFVIGYLTTGNKLNLFTVFAILSCLPASKATVGVIVKFPIQPVDEEKHTDILNKSNNLTISYDVILTSKENIMPIECIAIAGNTVYGYTSNHKIDINKTTNYMKEFLAKNECGKVNVKIFQDFAGYLARVGGLNNIASIERNDTKELEEKIKYTIKLYSM